MTKSDEPSSSDPGTASPEPPAPPTGTKPFRTLEDLHRDVAFANSYRLELIKHTISLATAVFVFTLAFLKDYVGTRTVVSREFMTMGWVALTVSIIGGLGHMATWDRYYISYRDYAKDREAGDRARKRINNVRVLTMLLQFGGLAFGLITIVAFYAENL